MNTLWILLLLAPSEAAGRSVGPFDNAQQCAIAEKAYTTQMRRFAGQTAVCIEISGRVDRVPR